MSKLSKRQELAVVAGTVAILAVFTAALGSIVDSTTLLIGLTGLGLIFVIGGYILAAERYARSSLRVAVSLAIGWMLLPLVLFAAVVLVWGSPGGSPGAAPPGSHSTTVITYRNGTEVGRSTEDSSGSGNALGILLVVYCTGWAGYAAYLVYLGYRGQPGHGKGGDCAGQQLRPGATTAQVENESPSATEEFIRFLCPACGKPLKAKREYTGRLVKCSGRACGRGVQVPAAEPGAAPDRGGV
jgi:hypothetical protein